MVFRSDVVLPSSFGVAIYIVWVRVRVRDCAGDTNSILVSRVTARAFSTATEAIVDYVQK